MQRFLCSLNNSLLESYIRLIVLFDASPMLWGDSYLLFIIIWRTSSSRREKKITNSKEAASCAPQFPHFHHGRLQQLSQTRWFATSSYYYYHTSQPQTLGYTAIDIVSQSKKQTAHGSQREKKPIVGIENSKFNLVFTLRKTCFVILLAPIHNLTSNRFCPT